MAYTITGPLLKKFIALANGAELAASDCKGSIFKELLKEGLIIAISQGRGFYYKMPNETAFRSYLAARNDAFKNLEKSEEIFRNLANTEQEVEMNMPRQAQAMETGNSKMRTARSCKGFLVNSYEPIPVILNGKHFDLNPPDGSFIFIADYENFFVPENVIVVGIENMENFRYIQRQRNLFKQFITSRQESLLFVARYPQSKDLIRWLCHNNNHYVHFGDLDLAGIHIYLTEFYAKLEERSTFFIPQNAEACIEKGSRERYDNQILKFENMKVTDPRVLPLVNWIRKYHKCYDQEGFID